MGEKNGEKGGDGGDGCEIPIGRDDTGRVAVCVLYRNGLYRKKINEKGVEKCAKTKKNVRFCMNGVFRGALEPGIGPGGSKNIPYSEMM